MEYNFLTSISIFWVYKLKRNIKCGKRDKWQNNIVDCKSVNFSEEGAYAFEFVLDPLNASASQIPTTTTTDPYYRHIRMSVIVNKLGQGICCFSTLVFIILKKRH